MKIRFYLALILTKIYGVYKKIIHDEKDDRAGLLAYKVCPNFNHYIKKPKLVIMVTGTNGKTTTTNLINDIFKLSGKKTVCNDWGANTIAGHAKILIDGVTIFNRPKVDVAILEADEVTLPKTAPDIKPNYLMVTNIARDTIRRNGNYYYIQKRISEAIDKTKDVKLILNADDPLSNTLTKDDKNCIYYSIAKHDNHKIHNLVDDFTICPKCHSKIVYLYKHYRHIGKVKCSNCDFKSKDGNYIATDLDYSKKYMIVKNKDKEEKYTIDIDNIYNAFNYLSVIALFKDLKMDYQTLNNYIKNVNIPKIRKGTTKVGGIEIINYTAKGQTGSACSTVCEYIATIKEEMEIILLIDEALWHENSFETITWFYETDFDLLNMPNLKKIIVGSKRYKDYQLRLLLTGLPKNKIVCIRDETETYKYLDLKNTKKIFILYDVDAVTKSHLIRDKIIERINKEGINNED